MTALPPVLDNLLSGDIRAPFELGSDLSHSETGAPVASRLARARELLADHVDDAQVQPAANEIVQALEEIHLSRHRIQSEHIAIGSRLDQIYQVLHGCIAKRMGDGNKAHVQARTLLYRIGAQELDLHHSTIYLYIRAYRKFANNADALHLLNIGEMALLVKNDITDLTVDVAVQAKRDNPTMPRAELDTLIRQVQEAQEQAQLASMRVEEVQEQLARSEATLTEQQRENAGMKAQMSAITEQHGIDRRTLSDVQLELTTRSSAMSSMEMTISTLSSEREALQSQLKDAEAAAKDMTTPPPAVPDGYVALETAIEDKRVELAEISQKLDIARAAFEQLQAKEKEKQAELQEHGAVQQAMTQVMVDVEKLSQTYKTAQLVLRAAAGDERYAGMFSGMVTLLGNIHKDLTSLHQEDSNA
jgi:hypothetical protein